MHLDQTLKKAGIGKESRGHFKISSNKNLIQEEFFFLFGYWELPEFPQLFQHCIWCGLNSEKIGSDAEAEMQTISLLTWRSDCQFDSWIQVRWAKVAKFIQNRDGKERNCRVNDVWNHRVLWGNRQTPRDSERIKMVKKVHFIYWKNQMHKG